MKSFDNAFWALQDKRDELNDYVSPCSRNPQLFDERRAPMGRREGVAKYRLRLKMAQSECNSCMLLTECQTLAKAVNPAKPEITGILAGQVFVDEYDTRIVSTKEVSQ